MKTGAREIWGNGESENRASYCNLQYVVQGRPGCPTPIPNSSSSSGSSRSSSGGGGGGVGGRGSGSGGSRRRSIVVLW